MKNSVLARPNLKGFLLGALLVAAIEQALTTQSPLLSSPRVLYVSNEEPRNVREALRLAVENPSARTYAMLSDCYVRQGDIRRALIYLRKADFLAQAESQE